MNDELNNEPFDESPAETYPIEPRYHPVHKITRAVYDFLASAKLAMFLLVAILACSVTGVTVFRGQEAGVIFNSLWFNALLILLIINVACCFFGRIWGRRVTIISFGMILFHLSFVAMFVGIVYNSLFFFRGIIRLTEGETLPNDDPQSYDIKERGRFFRYSRLAGETTLNKMVTGYKVDGQDKRVAYDITVGRESDKKQGIIYLTNNLDYNGFRYFPEKQGYSILTIIYDKQGELIYGVYVPLQSLKIGDDKFIYTSGSKLGPGSFEFPRLPDQPLIDLQVALVPRAGSEGQGMAQFAVRPLGPDQLPPKGAVAVKGEAPVGSRFVAGEYQLAVDEIRSWVAMNVRYEPGQPLVLTSLWAGLAGMVITFFGRIRRSRV